MQTEMRLRLLMNGMIVGYEIKQIYNPLVPHSKIISTWKSADLETYYPNDKPFDYDAFELGVKVGDEWYYEGDICEEEDAGYRATFRLYYERGMFCVEYEDAGAYPLDEILTEDEKWGVSTKVIGNIHEENTNA